MSEKTWPALQSCKRRCYDEANDSVVRDRLSQLSDDLLMLIMSSLTMKEVTKTSALSHRWKNLCRFLPVLLFEAHSPILKRVMGDRKLKSTYNMNLNDHEWFILHHRPGFTRWVNYILEAHLAPTIDELRVVFDLDRNNESDIDKWLVFALTKQVKRLELNLTPFFKKSRILIPLIDFYSWPLECRMSSLVVPSKLGSLSLKYVNVTVMDIERILLSCSVLENLCIVGGYHLTDIKLPHSPLELKHLEVSRCPHLLCIDILAPKLVSFIHHGDPVGELNIRDASFLSELTIGNGLYIGEVVAPACDSFSKYFSQLKYLSWSVIVNQSYTVSKFNLGIDNPRSMKNLTHLRISVKSNHDESLLGWAHLIEASPLLQKLHVKGQPIDIEFATYVVENSVMLKEVILDIPSESNFRKSWMQFDEKHAKECAEELGRTLPQDVTFRYTTA